MLQRRPQLQPLRLRLAPQRTGFTLIELLMVIALIIILVTITVAISANLLTGTKEKATRATIAKVHQLLEDRRRAIDIAAEGKQFDQEVRFLQARVRSIPGLTSQQSRALQQALPILVIKSKMKQLFPQAAANKADHAEMLYETLTQKEVFGVEPVGEEFFSSSEKKDTDGDGNLELVDAWGEPLRFYLAPTRLVRPEGLKDVNGNGMIETGELSAGLNPDLAQTLIPSVPLDDLDQDPDDPMNLLLLLANTDSNGYQKAEGAAISPYMSLSDVVSGLHTLSTYHIPLIVSAGADRELGLDEPFNGPPNFGHLGQPVNPADPEALYDNITNYQTPGSD